MKGETSSSTTVSVSTSVAAQYPARTTAVTTTDGTGRSSRSAAPSTKASSTLSQHRQLSKIQSQQVDAAFEEIFGYKWGTVFTWRLQDPGTSASLTSEQIMLAKVIGKKRAAQLLQLHPIIGGSTTTTTAIFNNNRDRGVIRKHQTYKHKTDTSASSIAKTAASFKKAAAGSISSGSGSPKGSTMPPAVAAGRSGGGMDQLLAEMSQSGKVTTTAKTAADWESFKATALGPGLGDKLEEHAESKGAYLKRQDFLTRVDQRQFEKEKAEREQTRAARDRS
jgi:Bucentaur or craniofacial development